MLIQLLFQKSIDWHTKMKVWVQITDYHCKISKSQVCSLSNHYHVWTFDDKILLQLNIM